ncbi:MAG: ADP-ribose pyrophosphatase [Myxococcales bacterium]|nr:ADP-ribose pyrophosphatase [Myxococcales bacterium]
MSSTVRVLGEGRYIRLLDEDGWEYITRHSVSGVVVLVAITPARELVLVEQYRRAVHGVVVELPAGLVGDTPDLKAESLATAAHRELLEETGFSAREMVELVAGPIAVGVSDEIVTFFEARGLERVGPGGGDASENITVQVVPLDGLTAFLDGRRAAGLAIDPKIFAGLYLAGVAPRTP